MLECADREVVGARMPAGSRPSRWIDPHTQRLSRNHTIPYNRT